MQPTEPLREDRRVEDAFLKVAQLEIVYNHVQLAVQGVSISVREGEIVALLGTNGAGKTTTLRGISGFLPADNAEISDGHVNFDGEQVAGLRPHELAMRGLALVPERDKIFATLSVAENLAVMPTRTDGDVADNRDLVDELFPILAERSSQTAGYLSGGERQMLAIAKALLLSPRLLLVDELSFGLAPQIIDSLMKTLRAIHQEQGMTVLLVEQNAHAALEVADYIYILESGRVVFDGTPATVREHEDVVEFYLGGEDQDAGFSNVKQYKRKRRWWG